MRQHKNLRKLTNYVNLTKVTKKGQIDKYINSLQSNNDNLKLKLTQITSVADKQLDRRVKLDIDNEENQLRLISH